MTVATPTHKVGKYLVMPIKGKWFYMLYAGTKLEEYREIKPYYEARLRPHVGKGTFEVIFRNGYGREVPSVLCKCTCHIGNGRSEWGGDPNVEYFVLVIMSVCFLPHREKQRTKAV